MSSSQDASMDARQIVSSEAEAAVAANNLDMEIEDSSSEGVREYDPNKNSLIIMSMIQTVRILYQLSKESQRPRSRIPQW